MTIDIVSASNRCPGLPGMFIYVDSLSKLLQISAKTKFKFDLR